MPFRLFMLLLLLLAPRLAVAEQARIAVAANFIAPAQVIAARFERSHPHRLELIAGSSARFYAQVRGGAPFDAFLSADRDKPARLVEEGFAVADSLGVYALGRLVLWTAQTGVAIGSDALAANTNHSIALANPRLAPYGLAASEVIGNLGLADPLAGRLVMGENVSQAYQFVATGNAALGFVSLSQVGGNAGIERGSGWLVPAELHSPIRQYAVLLEGGNTAARDFLEFLRSPEARRIIASFGYDLDG
ncbi:MAG: molybdate ABC transporter substrate-binding protein [Gammaproteobacteria bacterium]|nr:molybdate ABC transporter substrate-binding protein [Gammaproteobacteria bacterium]